MSLTDKQSAEGQIFIRDLNEAVAIDCVHGRCDRIKAVLEQAFHSDRDLIDAEFMQPAPDCYARRLWHRDPAGRYSVVAMVWGKGQGTPLHDHAGEWCVECVYRGKIKVVSYAIEGDEDSEVVQFARQREVFAGVGEAGALIPPFDYHTIDNAQEEPTVTVHVYGHELTWCNIFVPVDGGFRKVRKELSYDE